jgi:hypothetical protein
MQATKADDTSAVCNPMSILPGQRAALAADPHCDAFLEMNPSSAGLIANHLNAEVLRSVTRNASNIFRDISFSARNCGF